MRRTTRFGLRTMRGAASGFTLIELVAVMAILMVISATAVSALGSLQSRRASGARAQIIRDLTYARGVAMNTGVQTWVVFAADGLSYQVLTEQVGTPGRANAVSMRDVATNGTMSRTLNAGDFVGITITSASFDGAREVGFTWDGTPQNSTEVDLAAAGSVVLTGGTSISVLPVTGLAR